MEVIGNNLLFLGERRQCNPVNRVGEGKELWPPPLGSINSGKFQFPSPPPPLPPSQKKNKAKKVSQAYPPLNLGYAPGSINKTFLQSTTCSPGKEKAIRHNVVIWIFFLWKRTRTPGRRIRFPV
jgi:hypothetical protein